MEVDEGTLETANVNINADGFFGLFVLVPVIDGELIVERPTETILKGNLNGVRSSHDHCYCHGYAGH